MFSEGLATIAAIVAGVLVVAIVAVIVSKNANTAGVLTGAGSALSSVIGAAVAPVTTASNSTFGGG